jgi:hypothetical protein
MVALTVIHRLQSARSKDCIGRSGLHIVPKWKGACGLFVFVLRGCARARHGRAAVYDTPATAEWTCRQRSAPRVQQPCHLHRARACSCNVLCICSALPLYIIAFNLFIAYTPSTRAFPTRLVRACRPILSPYPHLRPEIQPSPTTAIMATNPPQLFLLADHIKLSLLERQRALSLNLPSNSQDGQISRSLEQLRSGIESLESQVQDTSDE